ncbi:sugar transferase [Heliobacterium undosum]|uniref:Sugar transferase n=2 Tax=Heliomicrobium undosum TaxID=121734 RepID=A0A845L1V0_9FIRM|nr:sugar transferase [Heliomicrobium undosum]
MVRCLDLIVGAVIFIIVLPIMLMIAVAIRISSPGPVFFVQKRLSQGGRTFPCFKFRTMVHNAEEVLREALSNDARMKAEWENHFKLKSDPRITPLGRFLRTTSLDELPQIINVLKGEMSLVGPRARPLYEGEGQEDNSLFQLGLTVKPGMTGLWQVSGRSKLNFTQRIELEAWYVQNRSLRLDLMILLKTAVVVIKGDGAY